MKGLVAALALASVSSAQSYSNGPGGDRDWLEHEVGARARARIPPGDSSVWLSNGLVERALDQALDGTTTRLRDRRTNRDLLRAARPVARVTIGGVEYSCGGAAKPGESGAQPDRAFLDAPELLGLDLGSLGMRGMERGEPLERLAWKRVRHHSTFATWPPAGKRVAFTYAPDLRHPGAPEGLRVVVHHELYDGVPVFGKRVEIRNEGTEPFVVDRVVSEDLAIVPGSPWVEARDGVPLPTPPYVHVESEYAMGGGSPANGNRFGVRWLPDPDWPTQINYLRRTPCLLEVAPENQMRVTVAPGESFFAPMAFLVLFDSLDETRKALTLARAWEVIAPWCTENPLMMHVRHSDHESVRRAIDQAAAVGFEMVILTFGSGFDMEDASPENLDRWRGHADYARSRGVELGGYTLLSSRRIQPLSDMSVNPGTGTIEGQTHGVCPSLTSEWGRTYFATVRAFLSRSGFDLIEHDGPYPGDLDATARPPFQEGAHDSRYAQWTIAADLYRWCRANGVYVNAPDWYFLVGSTKTAMGYRETNWSLPRELQVLHARQNVFDGTLFKRPSMGWMFVPLTEYHGGGAAATVEPLDEHRDHYAAMLAANLGAGVQACYRGPRLYDTDATQALVTKWVTWFKEHRDVLEAPIVHSSSRRADGREPDWLFHADPRLEGTKGMVVAYRTHGDLSVQETVSTWIDLGWAGFHEGDELYTRNSSGRSGPGLVKDGMARLEVVVPAGEPMGWVAFDEAEDGEDR